MLILDQVPTFWLIVLGLFFLLGLAILVVMIRMSRRIWYLPALLEYMIYQSMDVELTMPGRDPETDKPEPMTIEQFLANHPSRQRLFRRFHRK